MVRALSSSVVLLLALGALACSGSQADDKGESGYNVMPKGKLHGLMWQISQSLDSLDTLLREPGDPTPRRDRAVELLGKLETDVRKLTESKYRHPQLEQNLDFFLEAVVTARAAAEADPPNFYLAGTVSGSCVYCHDPEGGIRQ